MNEVTNYSENNKLFRGDRLKLWGKVKKKSENMTHIYIINIEAGRKPDSNMREQLHVILKPL